MALETSGSIGTSLPAPSPPQKKKKKKLLYIRNTSQELINNIIDNNVFHEAMDKEFYNCMIYNCKQMFITGGIVLSTYRPPW